jgi:hypothetical protein
LNGTTNHSPLASSRDCVQDPEDKYTFYDDGDNHLNDLSSIAMYMNENGILNSNNIFLKSSTIEDVEDVVTTKATNTGEFCTEEKKSPPLIPT